jgi:hypothetical protein
VSSFFFGLKSKLTTSETIPDRKNYEKRERKVGTVQASRVRAGDAGSKNEREIDREICNKE